MRTSCLIDPVAKQCDVVMKDIDAIINSAKNLLPADVQDELLDN